MPLPSRPTLLDVTTRPGERAADVVQAGYTRGFLQQSGRGEQQGVFIDRSFFTKRIAAALALRGIQDIRKRLKPHADQRDRAAYLEGFLDAVEASKTNQDVAELIAAIEEKHRSANDITIGLAGLHFFFQDQPRSISDHY